MSEREIIQNNFQFEIFSAGQASGSNYMQKNLEWKIEEMQAIETR